MKIADRIALLGTETAFAVSAEATAFAAQGNKVYSFHLGDLNLKTPTNVLAAGIEAMQDGKTNYCANAGFPNCVKFWRMMSALRAKHNTPWKMSPSSREASRPSANFS